MPDEGGAEAVVWVVPNGEQPVMQHQSTPPGCLAATQSCHELVELPVVQAAAWYLQHRQLCFSGQASSLEQSTALSHERCSDIRFAAMPMQHTWMHTAKEV